MRQPRRPLTCEKTRGIWPAARQLIPQRAFALGFAFSYLPSFSFSLLFVCCCCRGTHQPTHGRCRRIMLNLTMEEEYNYDAIEAATMAEAEEEEAPDDDSVLLSLVQSYDWARVLTRINSHPAECRITGMQGRTPLHVACDQDAPAVVIQALLKAYPEASTLTGTSNMNPLHITCSSQHASVHVVRVLLESGRFEQFSMRDVDGDTPLHAACRCGAPIEVIEVLLRANPSCVNIRDYEGLTPLLRLWVRYFVILGDDAISAVNSAADLSGELLEAWNKTELLLKCAHHGSLENRKIFRTVHAAAAVDCPRPIVRIAAKVYPHQLDERDEEGRTPLMIAAAAVIFKVRDLSDEGYTLEDVIHGDGENTEIDLSAHDQENTGQHPSVIEILLQANMHGASQGACLPDPSGRLPLHIALETGKRLDQGIRVLLEAFPESVTVADRSSRLFPFMVAATGEKGDLSSTFELLRLNPTLLEHPNEKQLRQLGHRAIVTVSSSIV